MKGYSERLHRYRLCPMPCNFSFYVHHHGAGHIMRAIAIAQHLKDSTLTFLGSDLNAYQAMIPENVKCIHLPIDLPAASEPSVAKKDTPSFLHYAPLHVRGQRDRNFELAKFFTESPETVLVVDVSVEVTLLARLFGVPSVVIRQHGNRTDLAHTLAYESAELIIAPYPETMASIQEEGPYLHKTLFSGGFSRFTGKHKGDSKKVDPVNIAVFIGKGGTCLNNSFVDYLADNLPEYHLQIIGAYRETDQQPASNVTYHGVIADPLNVLATCSVVICNAGHNIIMELADINKAMICIPDERPFNEQQMKAAYLDKNRQAIVVAPAEMYHVNWAHKVNEALIDLKPDRWKGVIDEQAIQKVAAKLESLYHVLYAQ